MQRIVLPSDLGAISITEILIFTVNKALILGEYLDTGNDDAGDMWFYFNPETGEIIPND